MKLTLASDIRYESDPVTGEKVVNRYTGNADAIADDSDWQLYQYGNQVLSRTDWEGTWPQPPTDEERSAPAALISALKDESHNNPTDFDSMEFPWFDEKVKVLFRELLPESAPDYPTYSAIVSYDDPRWESFLDPCSANEMATLLNQGGKGFEIGVKESEARAVMSSFNRIGATWTGGDYRLLTDILRSKWGFRGLVVCDFNTNIYQNSRQMAYAGGDLNRATLPVDWCDPSDQADAVIIRQNTKNILYTLINSNAMSGEITGCKPPMRHYLIIGFDVLLALIVGIWGFFAIRKSLKMAK
ncbi:MAG: hypothetical protein IKP40_00455 [Clostridia bacterium]|nr:hypothetical protein [Clostridia bacterium]